MTCMFNEDGVCYNADMLAGEECSFPNNKKCPETYQNLWEEEI